MIRTYKPNYCVILVLMLSVFLDGCASMDQAECVAANWHALGLGDGQEGKKSTHYSEYRKDCSAFGVSVDADAYIDGWETGIRNYCTRDNGFRVGVKGSIYQHSCPSESEDRFSNSYQTGRAVFLKQMRVNTLRREVQKSGDDLSKPELTEEQRNSLSAKRKHAKRDLERANIALLLTKSEARKQGFPVSY